MHIGAEIFAHILVRGDQMVNKMKMHKMMQSILAMARIWE